MTFDDTQPVANVATIGDALEHAAACVANERTEGYARRAVETGGIYEMLIRVKPDTGSGVGVQIVTSTRQHRRQILFRGGLK